MRDSTGSAGPDRRVRQLAPDCAICRPSVLLHGANEIEIHQEVQVLVSAGKADAQVRRTHLEPEMHRAERVSQHSIQECLLAMWSILGVGSRGRLATGRRSSRCDRSRPAGVSRPPPVGE